LQKGNNEQNTGFRDFKMEEITEDKRLCRPTTSITGPNIEN
jgi:hypothetical protein